MSITSKKEASQAARVLSDPNASAIQKSLAGSALRQVDPAAETSPSLEQKASRALQNPRSSDETKSLAGSVLAQSTAPANKR